MKLTLLPALAVAVFASACQSATVPAVVSPQASAAATAPGIACHAVAGKADRTCTPGATNPQVIQNAAQDTTGSTICRKGWTATIRPPMSYTERLKTQQMRQYGLVMPLSAVEEDHLIPLEVGGNPTDPKNLWPEQWNGVSGAHAKDREEDSLHRAVCGGRMKLADAQAKIVQDWSHP